MGAYSFLATKEVVLNPEIWQVSHDLMLLFRARFVCMVYHALSQMRAKDVSIEWEDFEQLFMKHVDNLGEQYVIIDTDTSMNAFIDMDKPKDGRLWEMHRHYKGAYYFNKELSASYYFSDISIPESIRDTIIVVRFADLPVLISTKEGGDGRLSEVAFTDESDREKGFSAVRITVYPGLIVKYNKNTEYLRVRIKKKKRI